MIAIGEENDRFARALEDEALRQRLMVEYARKSKICGWAAVLQAGIALALLLLPGAQKAHYVFFCIALGFLILCLRSRRDLKLLKLASQQGAEKPPSI